MNNQHDKSRTQSADPRVPPRKAARSKASPEVRLPSAPGSDPRVGVVAGIAILEKQLAIKAPQIRKLLPQGIDINRLIAVTMRAVRGNPRLLHCDRTSLLCELLKCADDGLMPDGREAILIVHEDRTTGQLLARYVPMYQGILKRAKELGDVTGLTCNVVHEADKFRVLGGDADRIEHELAFGPDRGDITAAYVIFRGEGGKRIAANVVTRAEIEATRQLSHMAEGDAWTGHFKEMARKTVIRQGAKFLPMSAKLRTIIERDDDLVDLGGRVSEPASVGGRAPAGEYNPGIDNERYDDDPAEAASGADGAATTGGDSGAGHSGPRREGNGETSKAPPIAIAEQNAARSSEAARRLEDLDRQLSQALSQVGLDKAVSTFDNVRPWMPKEAIARADHLIAATRSRIERRTKAVKGGSR